MHLNDVVNVIIDEPRRSLSAARRAALEVHPNKDEFFTAEERRSSWLVQFRDLRTGERTDYHIPKPLKTRSNL